jgi:phosphatidylglycerophosphate synthase
VNEAYPPDKRENEKWYPGFKPFRVIAIAITPLLLKVKVSPNFVSVWSILMIGLSSAAFAMGEYSWGAIGLIAGMVLDAADGQIARITDSGSAWGGQLERIQADVGYLFLLPCIAIGLVGDGVAETWLVYTAFVATALYVRFRAFYAYKVPFSPERAPFLLQLTIAQLKPHDDFRKANPLGALIFHLHRNAINQLGFLYPAIIVMGFLWPNELYELVLVATLATLVVGSATALGLLLIGSKMSTYVKDSLI